MVRLPTATDVGRVQSRTAAPIVGAPSLAPVQDALRAGASALDRRADFEARQARAGLSRTLVEIEAQLEEDRDWKTLGERYEQSSRAALDGALSSVGDPRRKEALREEAETQILNASLRVRRRATSLERDDGRAGVEQGLADLRQAALLGDPSASMIQAEELVQEAVSLGYLSQEEAGTTTRNWENGVAVDRARILPPGQRIETLEAMKGRMPELERIQLLRRARSEFDTLNTASEQRQRGALAQQLTDRLFAEHGDDVAQIRGQIRQTEDPELRELLERETDARLRRNEADRRAGEAQLLTQAQELFDAGTPTTEWPVGLTVSLPDGAFTEFKRREAGQAATTEAGALAELEAMNTQELAAQADNLTAWRARLSDTDYARFERDVGRAQSALEAGPGHFRTELSEFSIFAEENRIKGDRLQELGNFYEEERAQFFASNGREPTGREVRDILQSAQIELLVGRHFGLFPKTRRVSEIPEDVRDALEAELSRAGKPPTPENLSLLYRAYLEGEDE